MFELITALMSLGTSLNGHTGAVCVAGIVVIIAIFITVSIKESK